MRGSRRNDGQPRIDSLPEHAHWVDRGCDVSPHCLECPLPMCKYEGPWQNVKLADDKTALIAQKRKENPRVTVEELSMITGLSRRSIFRHLSKLKEDK